MDKKAIIEAYVECKAVIKETEEKMKELQDQIKSFAEVDDVFELEHATVSYQAGKSTYRYSPELTEREKQIKEDQKSEQKRGIAEVVPGNPFLVVKFKKVV